MIILIIYTMKCKTTNEQIIEQLDPSGKSRKLDPVIVMQSVKPGKDIM